MPTPYTTPTEEEILTIVTHSHLHPRCYEMMAQAKFSGPAVEQALAAVFPATTRECHRLAKTRGQTFWRVVADYVECGFFEKTQLTVQLLKPVPFSSAIRSSTEPMKTTPLHPVLGHPWWDKNTTFQESLRVDDYLLMSHTS